MLSDALWAQRVYDLHHIEAHYQQINLVKMKELKLVVALCVHWQLVFAQEITIPQILDIHEDDRVATIFWNSKSNTYEWEYDPEKRDGIFSYLVEWGPVGSGFNHRSVTPYRAFQAQPLEPGMEYQVRISALNALGRSSAPSEVATFKHDPTRVDHMRSRLTGFFDDMNLPMGPFDELKWNQAYSGCMKMGSVSQHINHQYHGHNVIASGECDRGMAVSRAREIFDFRDRTGIIEFDLDGAHMRRHTWYLDLTAADRKRDLTGHINNVGVPADPAEFLRIEESGSRIKVYVGNSEGVFNEIPNPYQNNACGERLFYCPDENLEPLINVRRHWRIELSKTNIRILINNILVIDGDLITEATPDGLTFEEAQINWLSFSYNTNKENLVMSMIHWDNFGFDAPTGHEKNLVVHNYTDGTLGTETPNIGNEVSIGLVPRIDDPAMATIPIPDDIVDGQGNMPQSADLMFTLQGGHHSWTDQDRIIVNGQTYGFPAPASAIPGFTESLVTSFTPYSAMVPIDPAHLVQGNNLIQFYMDQPRLLNIHIELTFPEQDAPTYAQPVSIFSNHMTKLMQFKSIADEVGPGLTFTEVDGQPFLSEEFENVAQPTPNIKRWYVKQTPVSGVMSFTLQGNSWAQMAAKGSANGISFIEILLDQQSIDTIRTDQDHPVASLLHEVSIDTRAFGNGSHELFVRAYDVEGNPSIFDAWSAGSFPGDYMPIILNIQNNTTANIEALEASISIYPNPSQDIFTIRGDLQQYEISVISEHGVVQQNLSTSTSEAIIDLQGLPAGMYFLRLVHRTNGRLGIEKIIKY